MVAAVQENPYDFGQLRRLSPLIIAKFGVTLRPDLHGWTWQTVVPGGGKGTRFKSWYSKAEQAPAGEQERWQKYRWLPSKPEGAHYFSPGELLKSIKAAGGVLWIVGGEVDVMTMWQVGLTNATCFFGDTAMPDSLAKDFQRWGVTRVCYIPDTDDSGAKSVMRLREKLAGSGLPLAVYQLVNGAKDVNDWWLDFPSNSPTDAAAELLGLPVTVYEAQAAPVSTNQIAPDFLSPSDFPNGGHPGQSGFELPAAFIAAVEQALGYDARHKKNVRCPFHDDQFPSAQWNPDTKTLYCYGGCGTKLAKEVGEKLGISLAAYLPKLPQERATRGKDALLAAPGGVPSQGAVSAPQWAVKVTPDLHLERLHGQRVMTGNVVVIPLQELWQFGGYCALMPPRKLIGIAAPSGNGKTTMLDYWIDTWLQHGVDVVSWGGEWSAEEVMDNRMQRHGGLAPMMMLEHDMYMKDVHMGVTRPRGRKLTPEQLAASDAAAAKIAAWPGQHWVVDNPGLTIKSILEDMGKVITAARAAGRKMDIAAFDYAQLIQIEQFTRQNPGSVVIDAIKEFVMAYDVVGVVTSQVNKSASRGTKDGMKLSSEDANYIVPDKFNLFLMLYLDYVDGQFQGTSTLRVTKNTKGKQDVELTFTTDYETMTPKVLT